MSYNKNVEDRYYLEKTIRNSQRRFMAHTWNKYLEQLKDKLTPHEYKTLKKIIQEIKDENNT